MYLSLADFIYVITSSLTGLFGFCLNLYLLYLIKFKSPPYLSPYTIFLGNTALTQMIYSILLIMTVPRVISLNMYIINVYLGPSQYLGHWWSYMMFGLLVGMGVNSFISIMLSMVFRSVVLTHSSFPKFLAYTMCLGGALIPTIMTLGIWDVKCEHDPDKNEDLTRGVVTNLENYKVIVGCDVTQPSIMFGILCASVLLIPVYAVMYYCRWKILKFINRPTTCITNTVTYNNVRRLIKALTVQSIVPLFTIFPASIAYTTTQFGLLQTDAYSYFIISALSSSCFIDPIVTCYYVLPYRRFTRQLFRGYDEERVSLYSGVGDRSRNRSKSSVM